MCVGEAPYSGYVAGFKNCLKNWKCLCVQASHFKQSYVAGLCRCSAIILTRMVKKENKGWNSQTSANSKSKGAL
jgi:hypothetical protein